MTANVRTRFAPSPTGYLHIGGVRTALFSWLYARHHGGQFILRIEDTDRERSTEAATQVILEGMQWLGLDYDEGPYYQSRRTDRYAEVIQQLLDRDHAYHCYCSPVELEEMRSAAMARGEKPKYNGRCRDLKTPSAGHDRPVVRFKNPLAGNVLIDDQIQGKIIYQNIELDDLILARADGSPTYNLTVVVDDIDMRISHVIRGDDHLNNTPRQINIFSALAIQPPVYAHVPMILGPDRKKISKRDVNTASVLQYRDDGILPEALLNYIVRLGWSCGDQEIFSREDMVRLFDVKDVNRAAAALNLDKLLWLSQHYLKQADGGRIAELFGHFLSSTGIDISGGPPLQELAMVQRERCQTLKEMVVQSRYFYADFDSYEESAARKHLQPGILEALITLRQRLAGSGTWSRAAIQGIIDSTAGDYGLNLGKLAQPLRVAVTGGSVSPSIDETVYLLGREKAVMRLDRAEAYIRQRPGPA